ncbi:MAG: TIGR04372 family glycosyltransferase [Gemmatimonadetes bacterium]|nr:TIGR04372 family glycosyltransferase [Gemmatimonadota bacterium]
MEHLFVRLPGRRLLLADVHASLEGHGVGYGMMLMRIRRVLAAGQTLGARVFFVPSRRALNAAVTRLECDDPATIAPDGWAGRALVALWWAAAPFRVGHPWLWIRRAIAMLVVGPLYGAVEHATGLPPRVRRFLLGRGGLYRRLKRTIRAYAARSEARWRRLCDDPALARLRALEDAGQAPVAVRLRLPPDREAQAARGAAALGIDPSAPIVTVHVRESGYRPGSGLRQRSWDEIRNARVATFLPAFRALVKRGYTVVRLGDPTMTPVRMRGVVDLATSPARTAWLEIWCTIRSEFLVGCDSGPSWLAVLLGVPVLTVNAVHFRDLGRPTDRMTCKLARDRTTGATLSISDMLADDFLRVGFKGDRFECVDNTPSDLRRAVIDMIEVVHGRERRSSWQSRFNRRLREVERQGLAASSALEGVAIMGRARGTLSRTFAKRYFTWRGSVSHEQVS